jgi:hypothetical protein
MSGNTIKDKAIESANRYVEILRGKEKAKTDKSTDVAGSILPKDERPPTLGRPRLEKHTAVRDFAQLGHGGQQAARVAQQTMPQATSKAPQKMPAAHATKRESFEEIPEGEIEVTDEELAQVSDKEIEAAINATDEEEVEKIEQEIEAAERLTEAAEGLTDEDRTELEKAGIAVDESQVKTTPEPTPERKAAPAAPKQTPKAAPAPAPAVTAAAAPKKTYRLPAGLAQMVAAKPATTKEAPQMQSRISEQKTPQIQQGRPAAATKAPTPAKVRYSLTRLLTQKNLEGVQNKIPHLKNLVSQSKPPNDKAINLLKEAEGHLAVIAEILTSKDPAVRQHELLPRLVMASNKLQESKAELISKGQLKESQRVSFDGINGLLRHFIRKE